MPRSSPANRIAGAATEWGSAGAEPKARSAFDWTDPTLKRKFFIYEEYPIKGVLLKFVDWNWTKGKESSPVADGTRLVALSTAASWEGGKPVEYRMRESGLECITIERLTPALVAAAAAVPR
jgi:hypothetical protein